MTMKLGVVTTTPEVEGSVPVALLSGSFDQRLERAAQLGYSGVELMVLHPADLEPADIAALVSDCGLEIAAIASGAVALLERLTLLSSTVEGCSAAEQRLHDMIDFAAAVGAPLVTIGGLRGRLANTAPWAEPASARQLLVRTLRKAASHGENVGVRLALEPLNRYESDIINSATEGLELLEQIGSPQIGLLLDSFHMNIEEVDYLATIASVAAAQRLFHVHLGDSNRLPPGGGHIDFMGIVGALKAAGYRGYLSAELLARPDADAAAVATIATMRRLM